MLDSGRVGNSCKRRPAPGECDGKLELNRKNLNRRNKERAALRTTATAKLSRETGRHPGIFRGKYLEAVDFPVGGIATGCIRNDGLNRHTSPDTLKRLSCNE